MDADLVLSHRRSLYRLLESTYAEDGKHTLLQDFYKQVEKHIHTHYPGASGSDPMIEAFMQKALDRFVMLHAENMNWYLIGRNFLVGEIYSMLKLHLENEGRQK